MLLRKCRHLFFNGGGSLFLSSLVNYSTASAAIAQQQNGDAMANYLTSSLGFSKETAFYTSNKVIRLKPIKDKPLLVVNYLENLGMNRSQIRNIVISLPQVLYYDVNKILDPKIRVFRELGLSESSIVRIIMNHKSLLVKGLDGFIRPRIEYFKDLFCSDDRITAACTRYALKTYKLKNVKDNVFLMQRGGFSNDAIVRLIAKDPKNILFATDEKFRDTIRRVESDLGIPRDASTFCYGIRVLGSFSQANIDEKYEVFRSFGWSDEVIREMVRNLPLVLCMSAHRMRQCLDYYMNELGYSAEYLSSHPAILCFNLERRVKPRNEVLKVLNEKKFNRRNANLYTIIIKPEKKFLNGHILPYKDLLPDMCAEYFQTVGKQKVKVLKEK